MAPKSVASLGEHHGRIDAATLQRAEGAIVSRALWREGNAMAGADWETGIFDFAARAAALRGYWEERRLGNEWRL
ncbi:hypothetical protein MKK69_13470 [Methylobacterium sp. J-026]|uniref:hypothetical protein n=1 Tax=Methylobacterium sp. J-026 TaxID=2836624 RepID=UPI001FB935FF|nr:hypothetical protein [Methylobacterium sp. J-026]MCJ2135057.1 hypothetical protein [Methylobacterium sp. J-026]